jgi:hypothetical protein
MRLTVAERDFLPPAFPRLRRRDLLALGAVALILATLVVANRHVLARPPDVRPYEARLDGLTPQFPAEFPLYPSARFVNVTEAQGQVNGRIYDRAWFAAPARGSDVVDWFRQRLSREYTVTTFGEGPGQTGRFALKDRLKLRAIRLEVFGAEERPTLLFVDYFPTPE